MFNKEIFEKRQCGEENVGERCLPMQYEFIKDPQYERSSTQSGCNSQGVTCSVLTRGESA